jgi:hypothetical protein
MVQGKEMCTSGCRWVVAKSKKRGGRERRWQCAKLINYNKVYIWMFLYLQLFYTFAIFQKGKLKMVIEKIQKKLL